LNTKENTRYSSCSVAGDSSSSTTAATNPSPPAALGVPVSVSLVERRANLAMAKCASAKDLRLERCTVTKVRFAHDFCGAYNILLLMVYLLRDGKRPDYLCRPKKAK
jgi:hypothetical protein